MLVGFAKGKLLLHPRRSTFQRSAVKLVQQPGSPELDRTSSDGWCAYFQAEFELAATHGGHPARFFPIDQ